MRKDGLASSFWAGIVLTANSKFSDLCTARYTAPNAPDNKNKQTRRSPATRSALANFAVDAEGEARVPSPSFSLSSHVRSRSSPDRQAATDVRYQCLPRAANEKGSAGGGRAVWDWGPPTFPLEVRVNVRAVLKIVGRAHVRNRGLQEPTMMKPRKQGLSTIRDL